MKKQSILYVVMLLSGVINAQGVVLNCQQNNLLFAKQTLSTDASSLDIVAEQSQTDGGDNYLLSGNVELNSSEYYLAADTVNVNKSNKISSASGNVRLQNNKLMLTADKAIIERRDGVIHTSAEKIRFSYPDSEINGKAQKISDNGKQQIFDTVSYSVCPLDNADWQMKADSISIDKAANKGVAKNATVEFLGIPILYSSNYQWVLDGRESGLLSPSFGSYNESANNEGNSYQIRIPYYFNIAPERDLLIAINYLSSRGSMIEALYRQLISGDDGRFEIEGHYLPEDDITEQRRWLLNSKFDLSINDKTDINLKVNRVSDADYFKDIAHSDTSESSLRSEINLAYTDDESDLALSLFAEAEQLVNNGTSTYTRTPELSISKGIKGIGGRTTQLSLLSTNFKHKDSSELGAIRTHLQANFKRSIATDGYSITPQLNLSSTNYDLDNKANQRRDIGTFSIDSKLFLEKETSLFNANLIQTLTPRLLYRYTPEKNQSEIPNFDSTDKNDTYEGLFSGQKFTGLDRISNANSFTVGLESEFINADTGDTYLSLKAAQSFHIDSQELNIDGVLAERRKYSNIATSIELSLNNFSINNELQIDPDSSKLDKQNTAISYNKSPRKFITVAHHDYEGVESAEIYGAYPITQNTHIFAGINRSLSNSITNKETTGIAYDSCCWTLRLAHFKEHIGGGDYDYTSSIELILKGFASTSPNLAKRLEANIPNYLANLND